MLGRDKITLNCRDRVTNAEFSRVVFGTVVTHQLEGQIEPMSGRPVFANFYRLILPRTLDLTTTKIESVGFGTKTSSFGRFENNLTPIYDARGRIRHYEGVVKAS